MEHRNNRVVLQTIIRVYIGIAKLIPRLDWYTKRNCHTLFVINPICSNGEKESFNFQKSFYRFNLCYSYRIIILVITRRYSTNTKICM